MARATEVKWEVWVVSGEVLGVKTCESKPKYFAFNCGAEFCKHIVQLHNGFVSGDLCDKSIATRSQDTQS